MQKVTKYLSNNGNLYDTKKEALFQDEVCELAKKLDEILCHDNSEPVAEFILKNFILTPKNK